MDEMQERLENFANDHPFAFLAIFGIGGFAVTIPLCALVYRIVGKAAGKAAAKEFLDAAGVKLGYNHN